VIAYLDTSALLRLVLREAGALDDLRTYDGLVSSELIAVESARAIDRLRNQGALTMNEAVERTGLVNEWLEAVDLVLLRPPILSRATEPMPVSLGTLDAGASLRVRRPRHLRPAPLVGRCFRPRHWTTRNCSEVSIRTAGVLAGGEVESAEISSDAPTADVTPASAKP
jgi:hypothetical protein